MICWRYSNPGEGTLAPRICGAWRSTYRWDTGWGQNAEGEHNKVFHICTLPTAAKILHVGSGLVPLRHDSEHCFHVRLDFQQVLPHGVLLATR